MYKFYIIHKDYGFMYDFKYKHYIIDSIVYTKTWSSLLQRPYLFDTLLLPRKIIATVKYPENFIIYVKNNQW